MHRNRSLVISTPTSSSVTEDEATPDKATASAPDAKSSRTRDSMASQAGWVSKRDRHMQLINSAVYDKEVESRNKAIESTRQKRILRRDHREKQKIMKHLQASSDGTGSSKTTASHHLMVNGLRFQVCNGGSKLIREKGEVNSPKVVRWLILVLYLGTTDSSRPTPKTAQVGGVRFLRSKNGNLYRSGLLKER